MFRKQSSVMSNTNSDMMGLPIVEHPQSALLGKPKLCEQHKETVLSQKERKKKLISKYHINTQSKFLGFDETKSQASKVHTHSSVYAASPMLKASLRPPTSLNARIKQTLKAKPAGGSKEKLALKANQDILNFLKT